MIVIVIVTVTVDIHIAHCTLHFAHCTLHIKMRHGRRPSASASVQCAIVHVHNGQAAGLNENEHPADDIEHHT